MAIPDYQTLMLPVLQVAANGEVSIQDCIALLTQKFGLTEDDRTQLLPSGKQTVFANRVHWAKTYLVHAGLLEMTKRAHFKAAQRGIEVLAKNNGRIDNDFLSHFQEFQEFRSRSPSRSTGFGGGLMSDSGIAVEVNPVATPEERIESAYTEITDELRTALLDRISNGTPRFFEKVLIDLLTAMGYGGSRGDAGQRVGKTGDGGIDGIINEDPLGLDIVYLQAKRYAQGNGIGVDKVREFAGSLVAGLFSSGQVWV